jgi:hypothetical protein
MSYLTNQILRGAETIRRNSNLKITDTPRTDAARKGDWVHYTIAMMLEREIEETENEYLQTAFALTEQTERAERAEAEVERIRSQLKRAVEIADKIWADCSNGSEHTELAALKEELK